MPQRWHVEVRGTGAPTVVGAFVSRQAADDYRDEYNTDAQTYALGDAYACLCDCPGAYGHGGTDCPYLIEVSGL